MQGHQSPFPILLLLSSSVWPRLQREEEAAYASSQGAQSHPQPSMAPFSKFEEKKTNEKTRKVTTVKKFFSPSSRTAPKKGTEDFRGPVAFQKLFSITELSIFTNCIKQFRFP